MTTEKNEKAFPCVAGNTFQRGIGLCDWFAGQALKNLQYFSDHDVTDYDEIAYDVYMLADAMMKARNK